jgi:hypothetical protein
LFSKERAQSFLALAVFSIGGKSLCSRKNFQRPTNFHCYMPPVVFEPAGLHPKSFPFAHFSMRGIRCRGASRDKKQRSPAHPAHKLSNFFANVNGISHKTLEQESRPFPKSSQSRNMAQEKRVVTASKREQLSHKEG